MSRKLLLTPKLIEKAYKYTSSGNYANVVCQALGISENTYYTWVKKGEEHLEKKKMSIYREFYESIKKAESEAEIRNVAIIQRAANDTWQAAAWFLERKYKKRWGANQQLEHTGNVKIRVKLVDEA